MILSQKEKVEFDNILKGSRVHDAAKKSIGKSKLTLLKSYSITKVLKNGKYVRN